MLQFTQFEINGFIVAMQNGYAVSYCEALGKGSTQDVLEQLTDLTQGSF